MSEKHEDLEVEIRPGENRAIVAGKTAVSFKKFVALILQRKVTALFKEWGDDPVVISSELLTGLASAPQDSQENRTQLILVTLGTGILFGIFLFALIQILLSTLGVPLGTRELAVLASGLFGLTIIVTVLSKIKRRKRGEKVVETMERLASLLSK